jgi:hypothetical protein
MSPVTQPGHRWQRTLRWIATLWLLPLFASIANAAVPLRSDFNGDGFDELVVAVPGRTVDGHDGAGIIVIVPGSADGIDPAAATQIFHRGSDGVPGEPAAGEAWGLVLETADFNADGFFDLAIGSPATELDGRPAGDVVVLFGSEDGLKSDDALHLTPDADLGDAPFFGAALATGAFYTDPFIGLAIGAPGAFDGAGAVVVYRSSLSGSLSEPTILREDLAATEDPDRRGVGYAFGAALAAGQFNQLGEGFGRTDLAIASQQRDRGGEPGPHAGRIYVALGGGDATTRGLSLADGLFYDLDLDVAPDFAADSGLFASTMIAGDFDGDGALDLAIGMPTASYPAEDGVVSRAGGVALLYGDGEAFVRRDEETWRENLTGFRDELERGDEFGTGLVAGDFNDDGRADLAIGTPFETDLDLERRGVMHFLYGTETGLSVSWRQTVHHDLEYYGAEMGESAAGDLFAAALGRGDFDGDGFADLAVAIPGRAGPDGEANAGWVLVMRGRERGATTAFATIISHGSLTALGLTPEEDDYLGLAVSGGPADCWIATLCMRLR